MTSITSTLRAGGALGLIVAALPAHADTPATPTQGGIEEVVVTAEKRASTVQDTPISITAISGEELAARGLTSVSDVARETPGLSMRSAGPGQTEFEARGLASSGGSSPTVGFYLDDTPLTPPAAAQNGKVVIDPDLFDLDRVEVLRGPQGTLYGSGSMGGTVKLITNEPSFDGYEATVHGTLSGTEGGGVNPGGDIMLNIPLDDKVAIRVVGSEKYRSGWIDRIVLDPFPLETGGGLTRGNVAGAPIKQTFSNVNDDELSAARASILIKPIDDLKIDATVLYQRITQGGYDEYDLPPGSSVALAHYEAANVPESVADTVKLYSLTATYDLGFASLTSATSYWDRVETQTQDATESLQFVFGLNRFYALPYTETDPSHQFSQELRLTSSDDGPFRWIVGGFFSDLHSTWDEYSASSDYAFLSPPGTNPGGLVFQSDNPYHIQQFAAFANASYQITDELRFTTGLRWFRYLTSVDNNQRGLISETGTTAWVSEHVSAADEGFNPSFDLSYAPDKDLTIYTTASRGFRPGGVNISVPTTGAYSCLPGLEANGLTQAPPSYAPDTVWNYEIGEKAKLFDDRVVVNGDFYYIQWDGVQQLIPLPCGYLYTTNAGNAHSFGPELELTARVTPELTVTAAGTYVDAEIDKAYPNTGLSGGIPVLNIPKYTGNIAVTYSHPLDDGYQLVVRASDTYVGPSVDTAYSYINLPAYSLVNLRAGLVADEWSSYFFIDNLTDKHAALTANNTAFQVNIPSLTRISTNQPRTFGIDVTYHFGGAEASPPVAQALPVPPPPTPAPPPVSKPEAQRQFQVFFDFDKSDITDAAASVIQAAADAIKAGSVVKITVTGHTDTVGSSAYNQKLSERRAAAVKAKLILDGVEGGQIATLGVGKSGLLVPTADGVREPQNRRAQIVLD